MNPDVRYWHLAAIRLARSECPLLGVERTSLPHRKMSAFDGEFNWSLQHRP
jgi:hypothetical protein